MCAVGTLFVSTLFLPVHVAQQPGQTWREAMQIISDALNETVGQRLKFADDKVAVLLQVHLKLGCALAPKFFQSICGRKPGIKQNNTINDHWGRGPSAEFEILRGSAKYYAYV